mgnify:CR=1 FL=1
MKPPLYSLLLLFTLFLLSCSSGGDKCKVCNNDDDCGGGRTCELFTDYITRCARPGEACKAIFAPEDSGDNPDALPNLAIADINQDSIPDLLSIKKDGPNAGRLMLQCGQIDGSYASAVVFQESNQVASVHVFDADEDGIMDVATLDSQSKQIQLHHGLGQGNFAAAVNLPEA